MKEMEVYYFPRKFWGYSKTSVDEFILQYKKEKAVLEARIQELEDTLITSQATVKTQQDQEREIVQLLVSAKKEANDIVKNAQIQAKQLFKEAKQELETQKQQNQMYLESVEYFKERLLKENEKLQEYLKEGLTNALDSLDNLVFEPECYEELVSTPTMKQAKAVVKAPKINVSIPPLSRKKLPASPLFSAASSVQKDTII